MGKDFVVILVTVNSPDEAKKIASSLVSEKLVACVNIIPEINSIFHWQDKITEEKESLLIIKTKKEFFERVKNKVKELHSYQVPEIIALPIVAGSKEYLEWMEKIVVRG